MSNNDDKFNVILEFLQENPDRFSSRSKKLGIDSEEKIKNLRQFYFEKKEEKLTFTPPKTVPDEAVSNVLKVVRGISDEKAETIKVEHQDSMAAENLIGGLLEEYIADNMEPHGWVHCAGNFVKAIDFIKRDDENKSWIAVQVKNRDNTENSSSSAIRNGSDIKKWYRTNSKTGNTNWKKFPEEEFQDQLSEEGFQTFIKDYGIEIKEETPKGKASSKNKKS